MIKKATIAVVILLTFTSTGARQYLGPIARDVGVSKHPTNSLGQYLEACDPSYETDHDIRLNNDTYCAGYNSAIIDMLVYQKKACFPKGEVNSSVVLSLANVRVNQDESSANRNAVGELFKVVSAAFPCK